MSCVLLQQLSCVDILYSELQKLCQGKWEQQSSALDGTLQLLQRQLGDQLQVVIVDASKLPGLVSSLQLGDLPAVVIFKDGGKAMQLEARVTFASDSRIHAADATR
eukprot:g3221.t1